MVASLRAPLYANAFYLWVNAAATAVGSFAFWILVARLYDADDAGPGFAAFSILILLAMLSHLGLGSGLIRFLPDSGLQGPRLVNAALTVSAVIAAGLSVAFLAGLASWVPGLAFLREQPLHWLVFTSLVVAATLSFVQAHVFVAIRKAKYTVIQAVFTQLSRLALIVIMASFFGAFGVVASGGAAMALGAAVGFALLARGLHGYRPRPVIDRGALSRLVPFSLANQLADGLLLAPWLVLPLLVVSVRGSADGAYFYVAWFLGFLPVSASAYLALSLFAEGSHDPRALGVLSRNAAAAGLAIAAIAAAFFLLLGDELLLAFGRDYATEGATLLRLVALAAVPAAVVNVYLGALRVRKRVGELAIIAGLTAVTTVVLSSALLPAMGLPGIGIALVLAQGLGLAVVLTRLLTHRPGTIPQRMRSLSAAAPALSSVGRHETLDGVPPTRGQGYTGGPRAAQAEEAVLKAKAEARLSISVIVCALNEEESLPHVLPMIPDWVDEVLLVDGHSTDDTVASARLLRPDVWVVHQPGRGKGDALRCGIERATGEIIVTLDADGSTDPKDIPRFVEPLLTGYEFVKGSRFTLSWPAGKPRHRVFGNWVIGTIYNILYRTKYTDICSGYNAFWKRAIDGIDLSDWTHQEEPLLNARVKKAGLRVLEVGHYDKGRIGGETKQPSLRQGSRAVRTVIGERFRG